MSKKQLKIYNSETGEIEEEGGVPSVEPLRIPGILSRFTETYIPAPDEESATDILTIGALRSILSCWMMFGSKEDVLQSYLDSLAVEGFYIQDTCSGPALCVIRREDKRVIDPGFIQAEEIQ